MRLNEPTLPEAITFDLDDTLWPVLPTILRAESAMRSWLQRHAPATHARFDAQALGAIRDRLAVDRPDWAHDLGRLRLESLRLALTYAGDTPALAEAGYACFYEERQRVDFYEDALPALARLAARYPLFALSNGNADPQRVGLGPYFAGGLSAGDFGVAKPHASIFHEACRRLGAEPSQVLHVGDDLQHDVLGALGAGLRAVWLDRDRDGAAAVPDGALRLRDLHGLADALGC